MLSNIRNLIRDGAYDKAVEKCEEARDLFNSDSLYNLCFAKALSASNPARAVAHTLKALESPPSFSFSAVCHRNLANLAPKIARAPQPFTFRKSKIPVALTMTSCKRLNLLRRTLGSLHNLDMYNVGKILIVDDGSDPVELARVVCELIDGPAEVRIKAPERRGHANSMNDIFDFLETEEIEYVVHIEDDFEFYFEMPLISKCISILEAFPQYGQCLFNNGYKEEISEMATTQPYGSARTYGKHLFYEHIHGNNINPCSYWPHFSLRPGVTRVSALKNVGRFVCVGSFEKEYALRYSGAGWKTAYLEGVYCEHIGRKTKDRFGSQDNAYTLNQTVQFGNSPYRAYMVHLERRPDRLKAFNDAPAEFAVRLFSAVDGKRLQEKMRAGALPEAGSVLNTLFKSNKVDMKAGIIGCALSHMKLWYSLLDEFTSFPYYIILEDDVVFSKTFSKDIRDVGMDSFICWDVIFIGSHRTNPETQELALLKARNFSEAFAFSRGGTFGYIINHTGARKLLKFIEENGLINAIDTVIQKCIDAGLNVYYTSRDLVHSVENSADTDIQISEEILYEENRPVSNWNEVEAFIRNV